MGYYAKIQAMGDFNVGDRVTVKSQYLGKTWSAQAKRTGVWVLKEFKTSNWVLKRPADYTGYHKQELLVKAHMIQKVEHIVEKEKPKPKPEAKADPSAYIDPTYAKVFGKKSSPTGMQQYDPPLQSVPPKQKIVQEVPTIHLNDPNFVEKFISKTTSDESPSLKTDAYKMIKGASGVFEWQATEEQMHVLTGANPPTIAPSPPDVWTKDGDLKKDIVTLRPGTVVLVKNPEYPDKYKGLWTVIEHSHTGLTWVSVAPLFGGIPKTVQTKFITVIPEKDLTITYLPQ